MSKNKEEYNKIFTLLFIIIASIAYISSYHLDFLNLGFDLNRYMSFPENGIISIKENPSLLINSFLYIFDYSKMDNPQVFFLKDILILILISVLLEKRSSFFIFPVFLLSVIFTLLIKFFLFKDAVLHGMTSIILTYCLSYFFIAFKDSKLNLTGLAIFALYLYILYLENTFDYTKVNNYTEVISAFLASCFIFAIGSSGEKKEDTKKKEKKKPKKEAKNK